MSKLSKGNTNEAFKATLVISLQMNLVTHFDSLIPFLTDISFQKFFETLSNGVCTLGNIFRRQNTILELINEFNLQQLSQESGCWQTPDGVSLSLLRLQT